MLPTLPSYLPASWEPLYYPDNRWGDSFLQPLRNCSEKWKVLKSKRENASWGQKALAIFEYVVLVFKTIGAIILAPIGFTLKVIAPRPSGLANTTSFEDIETEHDKNLPKIIRVDEETPPLDLNVIVFNHSFQSLSIKERSRITRVSKHYWLLSYNPNFWSSALMDIGIKKNKISKVNFPLDLISNNLDKLNPVFISMLNLAYRGLNQKFRLAVRNAPIERIELTDHEFQLFHLTNGSTLASQTIPFKENFIRGLFCYGQHCVGEFLRFNGFNGALTFICHLTKNGSKMKCFVTRDIFMNSIQMHHLQYSRKIQEQLESLQALTD